MNAKDSKKTRVVVNYRLLPDGGSLPNEESGLPFFFDSLDGVPKVGDLTIMPQVSEPRHYNPTTVKVVSRVDSSPREDDDLRRYVAILTVEKTSR